MAARISASASGAGVSGGMAVSAWRRQRRRGENISGDGIKAAAAALYAANRHEKTAAWVGGMGWRGGLLGGINAAAARRGIRRSIKRRRYGVIWRRRKWRQRQWQHQRSASRASRLASRQMP